MTARQNWTHQEVGITGAVVGNIIAPGRSETLGTILGAVGGAAVGAAIERDKVRCR